jgi:hypothetical protein
MKPKVHMHILSKSKSSTSTFDSFETTIKAHGTTCDHSNPTLRFLTSLPRGKYHTTDWLRCSDRSCWAGQSQTIDDLYHVLPSIYKHTDQNVAAHKGLTHCSGGQIKSQNSYGPNDFCPNVAVRYNKHRIRGYEGKQTYSVMITVLILRRVWPVSKHSAASATVAERSGHLTTV